MGDFEFKVSDEAAAAAVEDFLRYSQMSIEGDIFEVLKAVYALGFDAGCREIQCEWDQAEELQMESEAGWDW